MFTGLIQSIGTVERRSEGLAVKGCDPFSPLTIGESVAVDGVCLTVVDLVYDGFLADVSEETLGRTTLGAKASKGDKVNLERALRLSDRLGGHLVSGHVDGLGEVISVEAKSKSWEIEIRWKDLFYGRYICDKASIALNGISLTVTKSEDEGERFCLSVIPHTWAGTSLNELVVGDLVNLEADLMAKYAENLLNKSAHQLQVLQISSQPKITKAWLESHGWSH